MDLPHSVYAMDLDGDGDVDVLSASQLDDKVAWYPNLGNGSFGQQHVISTVADGARSVFAVDLDGDGDPDVLSASYQDDKVAWYENHGLGAFGPPQVITTNAEWAWSVYATDLDGDGDADVLSASYNDNKVAWYENLLPPADCNGNGIPDTQDLANGSGVDCNGNGVLDSCELLSGNALDWDGNGILDSCDISAGTHQDCDGNGLLDSCEILFTPTLDLNSNLTLDRCEVIETSYCPANANSTGLATRLRVLGSAVASDNDIGLLADRLPANEFGFFLMGETAGSTPVFDGILCYTGMVIRLDVAPGSILNSGPQGVVLRQIDLLGLPQGTAVLPGDTWRFQFWHRDQNPIGGTATANFSDGVEVAFR